MDESTGRTQSDEDRAWLRGCLLVLAAMAVSVVIMIVALGGLVWWLVS
ncbi:hypothetical protein [Micromonospora craniellae]|nr:hypothetical protein [Micromonospora craniellae]QOC89850.1 hypothetical protein ID554_16565 [Micromonospora craniellae]